MKEILAHYFNEISSEQIDLLLNLKDIYLDWNSKINVISRKDIGNFDTHHLLHSLSLAKVISFKDGSEVIDIGTGGGFPGIPLAIIFPETKFTLVDSTRKKTVVVKSVAETLNLKNVEVVWARAEDIKYEYDFVVSRAVTSFPKFVEWTRNMIKKDHNNIIRNGILYLKGGDLREELEDFKKRVTIHRISNYFKESFFEEKKIVYLPL